MLALLPVVRGERLMKWCLSSFEVCRRLFFFFLLSTHITRFGEGKINKLGPAAGTQSRETSSCWGWVYSFRLVTRKAQSSDRCALFSSQKIPLDPEKLTRSEASSQELLQFCLWLFFKAGKFTMTWSAICQCSSLSVELCCLSTLRSGPGCRDLQKHMTQLIYNAHQTRVCVDNDP